MPFRALGGRRDRRSRDWQRGRHFPRIKSTGVAHVPGSSRAYGTRLYGADLYGADGLQWWLLIDWNNDGSFEANEAARIVDIQVDRGRPRMFSESAIERDSVGTATILLDNYDNRFSPWYTSSPLYPNVLPARQAILQVIGTDGTIYPIIRGTIDEPQPYNLMDGRCKVTIRDGWSVLDPVNVALALQANVRTGSAVGQILDAANWPAAYGRSLDTGSDTLAEWWTNAPAREAMASIVDSEFGIAYVANDGRFTFKSRLSLVTQTSELTLSQASIRRDDLSLGMPGDTIRNSISVKVHPLTIAASGELWRLGEQPAIAVGQTLTFTAEYRYNNNAVPAQNILTPVATTDYTASTATSSGVDITAQLTVSVAALSQTATVTVTNNGPQAGYITLLRIQGQAIDQPDTTAQIASDATSIAAYGKRQLTLDLPWQQSTAVGNDFANWLLSWLKSATTSPRVTIENWPSIQFAHDRGARITLSLPAIGLSRDYRIGRVQHSWKNRSAQAPLTTWSLEPVDQNSYWQIGTVGRGELGVNTRLGY